MKRIPMKKILIFIMMFTLFLSIGTFFHIDNVKATSYTENDPWYGTDLDFSEINESLIVFESEYVPFSYIETDPLLVDQSKTYVIETAYDLYMFSQLVNGVDYDIYRRLNYVLGNHIDYYDLVIADSSKTFEPVGHRYPFLGTFDGQGFEITNLYLEPIYDYSVYEEKYLGLIYYAMFSHVGSTGVIKNLGLINPLIIQPIEWGAMSYIAPLVGLNEGHVHHVYYIDYRGHQAGFNAEGKFHISGLVSKNQGTLEEAFVSTPHVMSLAVLENLTTSAVVSENTGTINHVYYDQDILLDEETYKTHSTGLTTTDFQVETYFDQSWFFNNNYDTLTDDLNLKSQYHLNHVYPILHGITVFEGKLLIDDAIDFVYMNSLFESGNLFRSHTYEVISDIDMNQVAYDAYQQASLGFNGVLTSSIVTQDSTLYDRDPLQGGTSNYHTIIGLNISNASYVGNAALYGVFSVLFGTIEHLNFIDVSLKTIDINQTYERNYLSVGVVAGELNLGTVIDVHIEGSIELIASTETIGQLSLGMVAGKGSGVVERVSTKGFVQTNTQNYQAQLDGSSIGGVIGKTNDLTMTEIIDHTYKNGLTYVDSYVGKTYIGGVIGSGHVRDLSYVISKGEIDLSHDAYQQELYVGGIFGYLEIIDTNISNLYHRGIIDIYVNQVLDIKLNGIGYLNSSSLLNTITRITNHGSVSLSSDPSLSTNILENMNIEGSFGLTIDGTASVYGIYQTQDQLIDLSLIDQMSGVLTHQSAASLSVIKAYQKGNLIFQTYHELTQDHIKISGIILGDSFDLEHVRQEGYIDLNVNHMSSRISQGLIEVSGLFETISNGYHAFNGYQGGNISITKDDLIDVDYDIHLSGIGIRHLNTSHLIENDIDPTSVEITDLKGSVDTMLNHGDVDISGGFNGDIRTSGIMLFNYGLITEVINLGFINIFNDVSTLNDSIEAAGIVHQMIGTYAQIKDTANHGDIKVVSNSSLGYAHASGLVTRNDKLENQTDVTSGNLHKYQKVLFSINYGDIYAYNNSDETSYTVADETKAKASGFLAMGVLSTINNVNFGNIFSNHLAGAMIGFLSLNKFGTLGYDEVYISNQMNYGRVREITGYHSVDQTFTIDMNLAPVDQVYHGFGAVVGKIHTATLEWDFVGNVDYPIDRIYYGYLLNFDERIDMFDQAPPVSSTWSSTYEDDVETAAAIVLQMQKYMATTNPNDQSKAPFNEFYVGGKFGMYLGKQIDAYDLTDTSTGMFYEEFAFRDQRPAYKGTDQYIRDYIQYIPRDKVNDDMLNRIETYSLSTYPGIYALSSSSGIDNGIFMPDNFDLEGLHEYHASQPEGDLTYLGDPDDPTSIRYALYTSMRQIKVDFATTIYDLEIKQIDINGVEVENGVVLRDPVIDEERALITYYLPSNAAILGIETPTIMNVESYVEVSANVTGAKKVLDLISGGDPTYTWVGTHKKYNNQMVEIGPYKETGIYEITSNMAYSTSNNLSKPLYNYDGLFDTVNAVNHIFTHNPHIYNANASAEKWSSEGYQVSASAAFPAGYAPYEAFYLDGYPTLYRYVGPSTETITYVESNNINGVSVYDPSDVRFIANTDLGSYQISETASLEYLGSSILEPISIPRSYGVYDMMTLNGEYIDSVEDHYGMIRVFSNSYQEADSSTYKDYDIRVIRTADESITDVISLTINGLDALNPLDAISELTTTSNLNGTNDNILEVSYETYNVADLYNMLQHVEIYHYDTQVKVNTSYYRIEQGHVSTEQTFDNLTGSWGVGSFTISFIPEDTFPSGNYMMKTTLLSGTIYNVYFSKDESSEKSILSLTFDDQVIEPETNAYTSYIPYGMFYDSLDVETEIVNFTNLSAISDVFYDQVDQLIPSYLDGLIISNFSTLTSVTLSVNQLVDGRYQYDVTYLITAEDLSTQTFTHKLIEYDISSSPTAIYKNGGETSLLESVKVSYEESPNVRVVYDMEHFYISHIDLLTISDQFTPLTMGDTAVLNQDYFIRKIDDVGYEVNLNGNISKGTYQYQMTYAHAVSLWGVNFNWSYTFDEVIIEKLENDQSLLEDILFVSDTIFSGFNTIVDTSYMDTTIYEGYMNNPSTRKINVLPTTGIVYNDYDDASQYYMIGQVQKTNLSMYEPVFEISDYAIIRRVIDHNNLHYDYQSEDLGADFSPIGDVFNYVHYRIYAEDFDQYPTHYTDYYIAVQDVTNNIRFEITIDNQSGDVLNDLFLSIDICQIESGCTNLDSIYQMGVFAVYDGQSSTYELTHFQTTMHGTYILYVDLDVGYTYHIILEQSQISGNSFYLEDSILPRKYYITVIITKTLEQNEWGYTHENTPLS